MRCVTVKNRLDFGDEVNHVALGLGLQLPCRRFALFVYVAFLVL